MSTTSAQHTSFIVAASWLISPPADPLPGGAILVRDGLISAVGPLEELRRLHDVEVVEYPGCALLPGLVNAHTHLELTHFPAWRLRTNVDYHPRRFVDWMIQLIKIKRAIPAAELPSSVAEGIRMCLESGTTAVGEIVNNPAHAAIYRTSPLAGRLYFEVLGHDPRRFAAMLGAALEACGAGPQPHLAAGLSPHTPYTVGEQHLPTIRDAAASRALPLCIHLSESPAETEFIFSSSGPLAEDFYPFVDWHSYLTPPRRCTSTELVERAGLLTPATLAVHCVHLTLDDAERIKRSGTSVVLCPRSNERLDVGRAPLGLLTKLGIPLALGTDSLASNDSLSLWDEMRFSLETFADLSPAQALNMTTRGGAHALGIAASHGSLEPGKRADFQLISHVGDREQGLLERVIHQGLVEDVYVAGEKYVAPGSVPLA